MVSHWISAPDVSSPGTGRETSDVPRIIINDNAVECQPGSSILSVLRQIGVDIPTLCHDDRLEPTGECRSCLVSLSHHTRLVAACATTVEDGMVIETHTPELELHRRSLLEMLASHYPAVAVAQFPDRPFHRALAGYGLTGEMHGASDTARCDRSHPYIAVDMSRCIDCYRCVRICNDVQGQRVWHVRERGLETRIVPDGPSLRESSCVACGACVDTCPTGALEDAGASPLTLPSQWTRTTCPYCGVGCEMHVGTRGDHIVSVRPVLDAPVSKGHLCVKGRYAFAFVHAEDRITQPMIRERDRWRRTSWTEARAFVATRLQELIGERGPDSIGVLGSARATNEDNYVIQKFARTVIGTNNVDCCARVCHAPSAAALKRVLGSGFTTNSFDDIERARTILVCGANVTEDHPVVGARIRQAARRGAQLIVIDPRRIELTADASCHLALRPGTNVALLNAIAHVIVAERLYANEFIEARVDGVEAFRPFIAEWTPARAAEICGVDAEAIRVAARLYATHAPAMTVHGLGLTEHVQGTDGVLALINLALLTGNLGKPGGGVNPLRGQNNVQGAAHMGCEPESLPGSTPLEDGRPLFEEKWKRALPRTRGLNLLEMMDTACAGRLKGLWAIGYDILLTNPNANETAKALSSLDLVIVQDLFLNETAREVGTVFLPACSSFEKDGTFMNGERRIQRVRAAMRPVGESKPDWQIVAEIARALGHDGFAFRSPEEIWNEVRSLCHGARGMTYGRLDQTGRQWPCPNEEHPGTALLHAQQFGHGPRASLQCVEYRPTSEQTTPEYPLLLITGRSLYQFNAGTMTGRTRDNELRSCDLLDMSSEDAVGVGVHDGERVRVVSQYGAAVLPVRVSGEVARGQLFATFQTKEFLVNALTGANRDSVTGTPEYKVTAVRVERVVPDLRQTAS
jgi:formate dehydrogenase major subunit